MPIAVLIADDHELVRAGLRATFERNGIAVAGEAPTAGEALRLACSCAADVMLLDIRWMKGDESWSGDEGLELLERIHATRPHLAILMYSVEDGRGLIARCRELGAMGYLVKGRDDRLLWQAVHAAYAGEQTWPDSPTRSRPACTRSRLQ